MRENPTPPPTTNSATTTAGATSAIDDERREPLGETPAACLSSAEMAGP
jgi:hypothetical protein